MMAQDMSERAAVVEGQTDGLEWRVTYNGEGIAWRVRQGQHFGRPFGLNLAQYAAMHVASDEAVKRYDATSAPAEAADDRALCRCGAGPYTLNELRAHASGKDKRKHGLSI